MLISPVSLRGANVPQANFTLPPAAVSSLPVENEKMLRQIYRNLCSGAYGGQCTDRPGASQLAGWILHEVNQGRNSSRKDSRDIRPEDLAYLRSIYGSGLGCPNVKSAGPSSDDTYTQWYLKVNGQSTLLCSNGKDYNFNCRDPQSIELGAYAEYLASAIQPDGIDEDGFVAYMQNNYGNIGA